MSKIRFPSKIIPPTYQSVFERQRVLDILAENQHQPLVWVHGPAGAGKTTLVSSWLKQQQAHFLWYRLDSGINVSADLFYFLSLSVQRNYPKKRIKLPVLTAEYADDIKAFAVVFFRQLFTVLDKEIAIVFDNCQEIENDPVFFHVLQIALNDITEGLQIVCISRNRPARLFSRLSLVGDILEINPELLRFTEAESKSFLGWLNPDINDQTSTILQNKAKGWAVALVLLSQDNPTDLQSPSSSLQGQQEVFSFLITEILANMDKASLLFLAKTAVFNEFTVTMAKELTGNQSAQHILDDLINKNFLIDRTDETPPTYSYHPIFRDLLNNRNKSLLNDEQLFALNKQVINILIEQEKIEEALPLYLQLQDWSGLKALLLKHSKGFINNGRHNVVITLIKQLPGAMIVNDPWLLFWYAVAIKPFSPNYSAKMLDKCYQKFFTAADALGLYSTWQFAVEAITYSPNDFSQLEIWFMRFDELREHYPDCPSFYLKIKFSVTALQALAFYKPQHPWINNLLKISEDGFLSAPANSEQKLICTELGHYYLLTYEIAKLEVLKPYQLATIDDVSLAVIPRISNAKTISHLYQFQGKGDSGLRYLEKCMEIIEQSGISLLKPLIKSNLVACHICRGDLISAQNCLDDSISGVSSKNRLLNSLFHFNAAWICALNGQLTLALEQAEQCSLLLQHMKYDHGIIFCLGLKARLLAETAQWEEAEQTLLLLANKYQLAPNKFHLLQYRLSDAWFGFLSNNQNRALAGVKQFLSVVSHEQLKFFYGWQPNVITSLCILAIEHEIEVEFALSMMQVNALCPPPPQHLEQWPWPVRIYSFNHLQIELNGQTLQQEGKSQKKIIELLMIIIALGSQDVQSEKVCECLWPDSDGDLAKQTLDTAIFRLRKMIGKSSVLVKNGRITFNPDCCWMDVLAFEATMKELDDFLLQNETDNALLVKLSKRLFHLYQGPFLKHFDSVIIKLKQKQLSDKLSRLILRLISYHEKQQNYNHIFSLIEQSMDRIPQFESDHQVLISTYQNKL